MSKEITHSTSRYTYRLDPTNPRVIERKLNRHNARFAAWRMFDSATEAKAALIQLGRAAGDDAEPQVAP